MFVACYSCYSTRCPAPAPAPSPSHRPRSQFRSPLFASLSLSLGPLSRSLSRSLSALPFSVARAETIPLGQFSMHGLPRFFVASTPIFRPTIRRTARRGFCPPRASTDAFVDTRNVEIDSWVNYATWTGLEPTVCPILPCRESGEGEGVEGGRIEKRKRKGREDGRARSARNLFLRVSDAGTI